MRIVYGNYVVEFKYGVELDSNGSKILRINTLYISKITDTYKNMRLSEWVTKEDIARYAIEDSLEPKDIKVVFSKQPRKRLRRFNIV